MGPRLEHSGRGRSSEGLAGWGPTKQRCSQWPGRAAWITGPWLPRGSRSRRKRAPLPRSPRGATPTCGAAPRELLPGPSCPEAAAFSGGRAPRPSQARPAPATPPPRRCRSGSGRLLRGFRGIAEKCPPVRGHSTRPPGPAPSTKPRLLGRPRPHTRPSRHRIEPRPTSPAPAPGLHFAEPRPRAEPCP